jgi:hypothetical protein
VFEFDFISLLLPVLNTEIVVQKAPRDTRLRVAYSKPILAAVEGGSFKGNPGSDFDLIFGHRA